MSLKIRINGNSEEISGALTVKELLVEKKVSEPDMVSVEINGAILNREDFNTVVIKEHDEVEFLYFMGGGAL